MSTYKIIDNDFDRCDKWVRDRSLYPSAVDVFIGLEKDGKLVACSGFGWFNKKSMHHHICIEEAPSRSFWWFMAYYAFVQCGVDMLIGITPSSNEKAIKIARHYGYEEHSRIKSADPGGDLIIQVLPKDKCKWLKMGSRI